MEVEPHFSRFEILKLSKFSIPCPMAVVQSNFNLKDHENFTFHGMGTNKQVTIIPNRLNGQYRLDRAFNFIENYQLQEIIQLNHDKYQLLT